MKTKSDQHIPVGVIATLIKRRRAIIKKLRDSATSITIKGRGKREFKLFENIFSEETTLIETLVDTGYASERILKVEEPINHDFIGREENAITEGIQELNKRWFGIARAEVEFLPSRTFAGFILTLYAL